MKEPVVAAGKSLSGYNLTVLVIQDFCIFDLCTDGYTYEKDAITEWMSKGNLTSPMTNEVMLNELLLPNLNLKALIQKYLSK